MTARDPAGDAAAPLVTTFMLTTNNVPHRQAATELRDLLPPGLQKKVAKGARGVTLEAPIETCLLYTSPSPRDS